MVTRNLGIYPNKQGHAFQFPIKSREGLPLLPGQWAKKDKFCKWANGSLKNSKHMLVRIWAIGTQEFFKLVALRVFFVFKAMLALDSFNTLINFGFVFAT